MYIIILDKENKDKTMKELEKLLKENSGLLSRMKERDGNEKLNKICEEIFKRDLIVYNVGIKKERRLKQ